MVETETAVDEDDLADDDDDDGGPKLSDPDDFVIYSTDEAEHIAYAIEEAFGVELVSEVVLAAANVGKLAGRVIEARNLLCPPRTNVEPSRGAEEVQA